MGLCFYSLVLKLRKRLWKRIVYRCYHVRDYGVVGRHEVRKVEHQPIRLNDNRRCTSKKAVPRANFRQNSSRLKRKLRNGRISLSYQRITDHYEESAANMLPL